MDELYHQFTFENHFKWGYNGKHFNERATDRDTYMVEFGQCKRKPMTFKEECYDVAQKIFEYSKFVGRPIDLMFSGGSESEMMVRSFVEQEIPCHIHIMVFGNHLNIHDISHAVTFCEQRNLPYVLHDLDLENFIRMSAPLYAGTSKCITPRMLPHMWLMERLFEGIPVMGMGECYVAHGNIKEYYEFRNGMVVRNEKDDYDVAPWYLYEREKINSWYRFAKEKNLFAIPGFFQYTPEIMLSFLEEGLTVELTSCVHFGKLSNTSTKMQIYEKHFPGILQRYKKDGFENAQALDASLRPIIQKEYSAYSQEYKIEYNKLKEMLKP